jgi:hypothetical protein
VCFRDSDLVAITLSACLGEEKRQASSHIDSFAMRIPAISSKHGSFYKKEIRCLNSYCGAQFCQGPPQVRLWDVEVFQISRYFQDELDPILDNDVMGV